MMSARCFLVGVLLACAAGRAPVAQSAQATPPSDRPRLQLEQARSSLKNGQFDLALKDLDGIVAAFPNTPYAADALLEIASYQFSIGDYDKARAKADELAQKYADSEAAPMGLVLGGRILLSQTRSAARVEEALAQFVKAAKFYSGSEAVPIARYFEADTLRLIGRNGDALDRFRRIASDFPRSEWTARARLGAGQCLVALGDPFGAMDELQRARLRFPNTEDARTALNWNTSLYRLHVRAPTQPAFVFTGRTLPGAPGKLRDGTGLVIGGRNEIFVMSGNSVTVLTSEGATARVVGSGPRAMLLDRSGRLVVVQKSGLLNDRGNNVSLSIQKTDGSSRLLDDPGAATSWSTGEYLVTDRSSKTVQRFSPDGKPLGVFIPEAPDRLAVNGLDQVAALERDAKAIKIYDRDGRTIRTIPPKCNGYDLRKPMDLAFDALGYLFVLDRFSAVCVFSPAGAPVYTLSIPEKQPGAFRDAAALALDSAGRMYIYDEREQRIQIYQ